MMMPSIRESQLFTLRIWVEDVGDGCHEIRGQIKHVTTGEAAYFREWAVMQDFVKRWLEAEETVER
jgi:hypothetical protein